MLSLIMTLFLMGDAQAQTSKINTNLYEQEAEPEKESNKSFTAKVKVVREESDGVEVFFEGDKQKGAYSLNRSVEHYGKLLKILEDSKKPKGPVVSVTADGEKRIKKVEKAAAPGGADPGKSWGLGEVPE